MMVSCTVTADCLIYCSEMRRSDTEVCLIRVFTRGLQKHTLDPTFISVIHILADVE